MDGMAIRSKVSKACASLVLGMAERNWQHDDARRHDEGFNTGFPWIQEVAIARYVDNIWMASPTYCVDCLRYALSIWSDIGFDRSEASSVVQWLDVSMEAPRT
eukprot:7389692-Lingulodinium_polyedra.AAC.1